MQDNLEQYIENHRDEFDMYEPDKALWDGVIKRTKKGRIHRIRWRKVAMRAAAVLAIFIASFMLSQYLLTYRIKHDKQLSENTGEAEIQIPELNEAELYYSAQVNNKLREVEKHLVYHPEIKKDLEYDLQELDSVYAELKNDLKDGISNEEVVDAMIQNYRLKLEILEELLKQLRKDEIPSRDETNKKKQYDL